MSQKKNMKALSEQAVLKNQKAKAGLVLSQPFFTSLILQVPMVEDLRAPTMYTDGRVIGYNPEFINKLTLDELKGVLCHEAMHIAFMHHLRRQERHPMKWNFAADYVINPIVVDSGMSMPEGVLLDDAYRDKDAETVYDMLPDGMKVKVSECAQGQGAAGEGNGDPTGCGEVRDFKGEEGQAASESDKKAEADRVKVSVKAAANAAEGIGKLPAGLKRMIDDLLEPEINWRAVLSRFLTESVKSDYSWKMPNKRYIQQGLYLPTLDEQVKGNGAAIMDTSGSVSDEEIRRLGSEIQGIVQSYDIDLHVLYVDTEVAAHQEVTSFDMPVVLTPAGGGGTCFRPGFEWLDNEGICPSFAVYLTDGWCHTYPDQEPDYPVLWVLTEKNNDFTPPFGEVLKMGGTDR